ncbi:T9SS type A sorting domain-containing protein, partial [Candidatus Latescibacterota bacterium]
MVVVFSKFKDEAPGDTQAPPWADELFTGEPGSVPHFFDTVSYGQYKVTGHYLPTRYELPHNATYYVKNADAYARDLLDLLDADRSVNFKHFDNDGVDGISGSGDDDGYVDYMVFMPRSRPYDFLTKYATGIMTNGLKDTYFTSDKNSQGFYIKLDAFSGCLATANDKNGALGSICGELSHAYGTLDLMDKYWTDPESDSAGVGYWDLLGRGALGWDERDGPIGPNAYNRMRMNCAGYLNSNIVDLKGFQQNIRVKDLGRDDGTVYRLWVSDSEYFMIEFRRNDGFYYDRNIPQSGLLIWHVLTTETNNNENKKSCDLECPDGRFKDVGYPYGEKPDPINGGDNLDFWSHDVTYRIEHYGNFGDAYDIFDGERYTTFGTNTNPNTYSKETLQSTGIEIFNIRRDGEDMVFDCISPPFTNWFEEKYPYIGTAFQRFASPSIYGSSKPAAQGFYLLKFGQYSKPEALVTIDNESLTVERLDLLEENEVDILVMQRLLTDNLHLRSSSILRRNVPEDEFRSIIANFDLSLEELNSGNKPIHVQKVYSVSGTETQPYTIDLRQNFPNPFNSQTTISYVLPASGHAALEVYNILGQRILLVDEGYMEAGMHTVRISADGLSSGIYLFRVRGETLSPTRKFTIIR